MLLEQAYSFPNNLPFIYNLQSYSQNPKKMVQSLNPRYVAVKPGWICSLEIIAWNHPIHLWTSCRLSQTLYGGERLSQGWLIQSYNSVHWGCLLNILKALNIPLVFREWIEQCVTKTLYNIVVNGELTDHFQDKKRLRQGDPLSSLLFILIVDVLFILLDKGAMNKIFKLHSTCEAPIITQASFTDDVLIFLIEKDSLQGILLIMEEFRTIYGLSMNLEKTELMMDGGSPALCHLMDVRTWIMPLKYIGVPLSSQKMKNSDFKCLLDKLNARFTSWTSKHLSFARRLQLIQSVIYSTISFCASIFILANQSI